MKEVNGQFINDFIDEWGVETFWRQYRCIQNHATHRDCVAYDGACVTVRN